MLEALPSNEAVKSVILETFPFVLLRVKLRDPLWFNDLKFNHKGPQRSSQRSQRAFDTFSLDVDATGVIYFIRYYIFRQYQ